MSFVNKYTVLTFRTCWMPGRKEESHTFVVCHPRCACKLMVVKVVKKHNCYVRTVVIFFKYKTTCFGRQWPSSGLLEPQSELSVAHKQTEQIYRVIHKSLRDFRTRLRNNQDRHGRKNHINRYRISPSLFCIRGLGVLPGSTARGLS